MSDEMEPIELGEFPMMKPKFITIKKTDIRLEIHLRGEFPMSEDCTKELLELYDLSETYETVLVFISSIGGITYIAAELISILERFDNVITIASGVVASAGFLIWGVGDLRVIQKHTWMMTHRETYGHIGQTDTHIDLANYSNQVYSKLLSDCCSFLTDEELERAKRTDVHVSGEEMIERGHAISWEQFTKGEEQVKEIVQMPIFSIGKRLFMKLDNGSVAPLSVISYEEPVKELDLFYQTDVRYFENPTVMDGEVKEEEDANEPDPKG